MLDHIRSAWVNMHGEGMCVARVCVVKITTVITLLCTESVSATNNCTRFAQPLPFTTRASMHCQLTRLSARHACRLWAVWT